MNLRALFFDLNISFHSLAAFLGEAARSTSLLRVPSGGGGPQGGP